MRGNYFFVVQENTAVEASLCYSFKNWLMKLKFPNLLNPLWIIIQWNDWSFYPSELNYFSHFNMRYPVCIHKNSNKKSSNFTTVLVRIFTNKSLTVRKCTCKSILGKIDLLLDFQNYIFMQKISELSPLILGMGRRGRLGGLFPQS